MLPIILGAVALGATGYGVGKLLTDDALRDNIKDKIQDVAIKGYEGIEILEEKMGLYGYTPSKGDIEELHEYLKTREENTSVLGDIDYKQVDGFRNLYKYKNALRDKLEHDFGIVICKGKEIKSDKIDDIHITSKMKENLNSYTFLIKQFYNQLQKTTNHNSYTDSIKIESIMQELFTTKIIKRGEFNKQSTDVIFRAMQILMAENEKALRY